MHVLDALMIPWVVALETKSFLVLSDQGFSTLFICSFLCFLHYYSGHPIFCTFFELST